MKKEQIIKELDDIMMQMNRVVDNFNPKKDVGNLLFMMGIVYGRIASIYMDIRDTDDMVDS